MCLGLWITACGVWVGLKRGLRLVTRTNRSTQLAPPILFVSFQTLGFNDLVA